MDTEIGEIDPRFASGSYEIKISRLVYSGLATADTPDLRIRPLLAESIVPEDPDGSRWRVTLRPGLVFHDGTPLTSKDVVATYESILDPATGSRYRSTYSYMESVEALSPLEVLFVLGERNASFLPDLAFPIMPAPSPGAGQPGSRGTVGSGPYALIERAAGRVVLEARPACGAGPRAPRRIAFVTVRDDNARVLRFRGGGADLAQNTIPLHLLPVLEQLEGTRVASAPGASFTYVGLNADSAVLRDARVRRALLLAIDRGSIVEHKLKGRARLATGMLPPLHWAHAGDVELAPYDPAGARRLLDEAGLGDPDGEGPAARFRMVFKVGSNRYRIAIARVIASYWEAVGIEVDGRPLEFGTLLSHLDSGSFEATTLQIPIVVEPNLYSWFFHSSQIPIAGKKGGANRWRYRSPEADTLMDEGLATMSEADRRAVYADLQRLLARDLPVLPLWHEDVVAVMGPGLTDFDLLPTAPFTSLATASFDPGP